MRGSEQIYENLKRELGHDEAAVSTTGDCFRFCESGPNVAVNGNVLHRMRPGDAARRIRQEIRRPSRRIDGVGTRSLDDLDNVLKDLGI
jgi:NADH:ubiquinone oxidoreductase subunit E